MIDIFKPDCVFTPWGWSKDIVELIWGKSVKFDDKKFKAQMDEVYKNIQYQCVIFAQYKDTVLCIDCCDHDKWVVQDTIKNLDYIYLKMQFNPDYEYPIKVYPFTYLPHNPMGFYSNVSYYRHRYKETVKEYSLWGRFIAVSLDRFNIAKRMRELGINVGGQYCVSPTGYETHVLDPIKPRERMPFDEYMDWCFKSSVIIEAKGFGDFTHRMSESFGMGLPMIRPTIANRTFNPVVEGSHYLNCGPSGEHIEKCLKALNKPEYRSHIIHNGISWYDNNCTPLSVQKLLQKIIEIDRG